MRILMIGGTQFVGRHITAAALAAGHEVTLLHRGRTGAALFPDAEHRLADRDDPDALTAALAEGEWDATIDVCAYFPSQVASLADALGDRGGRFVLVSTASVYHPEHAGFTEHSRLFELDPAEPVPTEITETTYGPLKVACERVARERFGADTLVVRPTYVIGPWDSLRRFDYWAHRIARGGDVLAPGRPSDPLQVIDARDIATFILTALVAGTTGTFHLVGSSATATFGDLLEQIRIGVGEHDATITWVDSAFLIDAGETADTLPLWSQGDPIEDLASTADPAASLAAGLVPHSIADSARDVLSTSLAPEGMLSAEREAELLANWRAN
jgi:2'-hydroxyisoflavone reductase